MCPHFGGFQGWGFGVFGSWVSSGFPVFGFTGFAGLGFGVLGFWGFWGLLGFRILGV